MEQGFRASMGWLHTWSGVVIGALLFAIFWMGTLAVFDREIDRWMAPMTRLAVPAKPIAIEQLRATYDAAVAARSPTWTVQLASERQPYIRAIYRDKSRIVSEHFDPVTGVKLAEFGTWAGTGFLYPFHYGLHIKMWNLGKWIVGFATMAMLVLCVSGVIMHRKIFTDFFTLRQRKRSQRFIRDIHTVVGVLGLPFNFMIALSGLIIFFAIFFPSGWTTVYSTQQAFNADSISAYARPKSGKVGTLRPLDAILEEARLQFGGAEPRAMVVRHPGDANAFVIVFQSSERDVVRHSASVTFDASTGEILHRSENLRPVATAQRFLVGLHRIQFRHWTLRFLYFSLGLLGCLLILTGFLFWIEARRKRHQTEGLYGVTLVQGLAVGATAGLVVATLCFFVVNRILPSGATFLGYERPELEVWAFYIAWLATFVHAWVRAKTAWIEQLQMISIFSIAAVLLNWVTTGDFLLRTLAHSYLWPVAGVDLMLLMLGSIAVLIRRWLMASAGKPQSEANFSRIQTHA